MIYPIGIQNFESLLKDGYAYVDKTALIHQLVSTGRYYFLSRPRRFGKSLLISTLRAYFEGKRDLFKGLAIADLEQQWTARPVFHFDLNTERYDRPEALDAVFDRYLSAWEETYGIEVRENTPWGRFDRLVQQVHRLTGHRVAILVDEYDKPLLQTFDKPELQEHYRSTMKAFYSVCKTQDEHIKFAMFTGVTKFSKVSVFSDLNNLSDISMDGRYAALCGITEAEIRSYFDEGVAQMAAANQMSKDECYAKLRLQYDGYHFCEDSPGIYNPFSLLKALDACGFKNYWFETGTPTFLVEILKKNEYDLDHLTEELVTADDLTGLDTALNNPVPLIYQSGYLTIKAFDKEFRTYRLGYPNKEVEEGFTRFLLPFYTPMPRERQSFFLQNFVMDLRKGDAQAFMKRLSALFADGNYQVAGNMELYFHNCIAVIMKMLGFYVEVERATSEGRMDMLLRTSDYIYIMEFKLNQSADAALRQIEERHYAAPFAADARALYKIGVNFDTGRRCITEWKIA